RRPLRVLGILGVWDTSNRGSQRTWSSWIKILPKMCEHFPLYATRSETGELSSMPPANKVNPYEHFLAPVKQQTVDLIADGISEFLGTKRGREAQNNEETTPRSGLHLLTSQHLPAEPTGLEPATSDVREWKEGKRGFVCSLQRNVLRWLCDDCASSGSGQPAAH